MVAIEAVGADGQSRWSLYSIPRDGAHERTDLAERPGGQRKVIGLVRDQTDAGQTHMLACLSSDRRTLVGIGPKRIRNLYTAPADITAGSTTILGDKVALVTLSSQLVVLDQDGTRLALCIDHSGQSPSAEDHDRG
jgi:hypothetical protein